MYSPTTSPIGYSSFRKEESHRYPYFVPPVAETSILRLPDAVSAFVFEILKPWLSLDGSGYIYTYYVYLNYFLFPMVRVWNSLIARFVFQQVKML